MTSTFRLSNRCRRTAIWTLLGFITIGVASTCGAWLGAPSDRRIYGATLFAVFWGAWACASTWLLIACWRARLEIGDDLVIWRGVVGRRQIDLSHLSMARWRPNGSVTLRDRTTKLTICLRDFEPTDCLRLIRFFRSKLPEAVQENWTLFCYGIARPLQSELHPVSDTIDDDKILITRRRWDWYFVPFILLCIPIGVLLWWMRGEPRRLVAPLLPTALWLVLRFTTPRKGLSSTRLDDRPEERRFLVFAFVWLAVAAGGIWLSDFPNTGLVPTAIALVVWSGVYIWQLYLLNRKRTERRLVRSEAAVRLWDERESALARS